MWLKPEFSSETIEEEALEHIQSMRNKIIIKYNTLNKEKKTINQELSIKQKYLSEMKAK